MYDKEGFITNDKLGIKFKYAGGSKRPYADTVTGVQIRGVKTEEEAKEMATKLSSYKVICEDADHREGWWEPYFRNINQIDEKTFHVFWVTPNND